MSHQRHDFLFEILTEELPPKALKKLMLALKEHVGSALQTAQLHYADIKPFATPRRLALLITDLDARQPRQTIQKQGPALTAAYDDQGQPTKACLGFAKACDTTPDKLEKLKTKDGYRLAYTMSKQGQSIHEYLPNILETALKKLPIPKMMRWNAHEFSFIRPIHGLIMLYGRTIIKAEMFGQKSTNKTRGHRFLANTPLTISTPKQYETLLAEKGHVVACFEKRKQHIAQAISKLAKKHRLTPIIDDSLLDEVTAMVELPVPLMASFPKHYLQIPKEALICAIQQHQKSFPLLDKQHRLAPAFVFVSNMCSKNTKPIVLGNERVMNARLHDAEFFYQTDLKKPLPQLVTALQHVVFQSQLGNLLDQTERLKKLSDYIAHEIHVSKKPALRAALLSKSDLLTEMVGEFPELQGVMGKYYALHAREDKSVAIALEEQYMPRHAGAILPKTPLGQILSLANRLDLLIGIFGIHLKPTGDKDPFGLRRAALAIIAILTAHALPLSITNLLKKAESAYGSALSNPNVTKETHEFIIERLKFWALEQGFQADEIAAIVALPIENLYDTHSRLQAIAQFKKLPEANSLAAANKRVNNLLSKEKMPSNIPNIDTRLLQEPAEKALANAINQKQHSTKALHAKQNYIGLLKDLATLRDPIDHFFDRVMILAEDKKIRKNRLIMLAHLRKLFLQVADISKLAP